MSNTDDSRAMSMTDTEKAPDLEIPPAKPTFPEGGTKAWLSVLACWCVMFNTFGYINAFGYEQVNILNLEDN